MSNIYDCVDSFEKLLSIEYDISIGRKGRRVDIHLAFSKEDAFHLMGLHYLNDISGFRGNRGKYFDQIKDRTITREWIESSAHYNKIIGRIEIMPRLEEIIDDNRTVFRYERKRVSFSTINADYLMSNILDDRIVYVFIAQNHDGDYFCMSLFPKERTDYTTNQAQWTLLYKRKKNTITGEETILYDRLK